jgi:hypothetical protein
VGAVGYAFFCGPSGIFIQWTSFAGITCSKKITHDGEHYRKDIYRGQQLQSNNMCSDYCGIIKNLKKRNTKEKKKNIFKKEKI